VFFTDKFSTSISNITRKSASLLHLLFNLVVHKFRKNFMEGVQGNKEKTVPQ
jgi:hypothetical protein